MPVGGPISESSATPVWVITAHALERYVERVHRGISFRKAAQELERHMSGAHYVKTLPTGIELWRGPKPARMRLRVMRVGNTLELVSVLEAFDRLRR